MRNCAAAHKFHPDLLAVCALLALAGCAPEPIPDAAPLVQHLTSPARAASAQPHLSTDASGRIVMSWLETVSGQVSLYASVLDAGVWEEPRAVASGHDWFVNWADFPSVVPIAGDLWAAHWLVKKSGGTYSYDVAISLSRDSGRSWSEPITPHRDQTPTEHGFVSLFAHHNGVGAVWLDGRDAGGAHHDHAHSDAQMTLRSAVVAADLTLHHETLLDERVCDCCATDAVTGPTGPLVVYRDRSQGEVRDISSIGAAGDTWRAQVPLPADGWKIEGCPVNGPALASDHSGTAVAWYSGADDAARVNVAWSNDAGQSFDRAVQVDGANALGRVDVVLLADHSAAVSWVRAGDEEARLLVRRVERGGELGRPMEVATLSSSRASGFPQMVRHGPDLVFAWTQVMPDGTRVKTAVLKDAFNALVSP